MNSLLRRSNSMILKNNAVSHKGLNIEPGTGRCFLAIIYGCFYFGSFNVLFFR